MTVLVLSTGNMNIFVLDKDPNQAAKWHCDTHVRKMLLESAQLLCTAYLLTTKKQAPYKPTHVNHTCSKWVRQSLSNYNWVLQLASALCLEYRERFKKPMKTEQVVRWLEVNKPNIPDIGLTKFVLCMPDVYKSNDTIASYREFYKTEKTTEKHGRLGTWTKNKPFWFI